MKFEFLKQKILQNIDKYIESEIINKKINVDVTIKKKNNIVSYSNHYYCCITIVYKKEVKKFYFFAKYADESEFKNLIKINKIDSNIKVPFPIDYFPDQKILLMKEIVGNNFLVYLLKRLLPGIYILYQRDVKSKIRLCATWLSKFHNVISDVSIKSYIDEVELAISRLKYISQFDSSRNDIINYLKNIQRDFSKVPTILTHRDFSSRNIIILNDGNINVVDWAEIVERNIYYSIAYFITNLESRQRHLLYSLFPIPFLEKIFLEEYSLNSKFKFNYYVYYKFKLLYYIEYLYEYNTKTGVFENWKKRTKAMEIFTNNIASIILKELK